MKVSHTSFLQLAGMRYFGFGNMVGCDVVNGLFLWSSMLEEWNVLGGAEYFE